MCVCMCVCVRMRVCVCYLSFTCLNDFNLLVNLFQDI